MGLWAPHLPPEAGGTGAGFLAYATLNEEIGRVTWAQYAFNCQAPDAGNGEILHLFGTQEQKHTYLRPLVGGEARSFFSMTEPDVSGADPTGLRTTAVLEDGEWVIDGTKWFSSGAEGAAFGIVMAVTDPEADAHHKMSQIIVPADAEGVEIERGPGPRTSRAGLVDPLRGALPVGPRPGGEPARPARARAFPSPRRALDRGGSIT